MNLDNDAHCEHCVFWIRFKGYSVLGICLEKCKWLLHNKREFVIKTRDPMKGTLDKCSKFKRRG